MFKKKNGKWRMTLYGKDVIAGYFFILPFLVGFFCIFFPMVIKSITFSLSNMTVTDMGYSLAKASHNGLEHYIRALTIDPTFNLNLLMALKDMCVNVPLILIFSFFTANLLNQEFKGRALARSIFFLPVIMTAGIISTMEASDLLLNSVNSIEAMSSDDMSTIMNMMDFLMKYTSLPVSIVAFISNAVTGIYDIVVASGVQILIFLAGLQGISPSLYEASMMEGATGWESFWKITFPMISPLILVNSIYTIIDSFTSANNELMVSIRNIIFSDVKYGLGSAMAWIYFLTIIVIILVVGGMISKHVFYTE